MLVRYHLQHCEHKGNGHTNITLTLPFHVPSSW
jgi:hypothetical protein